MRCLSFIALILLFAKGLFAQSPHGQSIGNLDCSSCHESTTWKVEKNKIEFNHDLTGFILLGQHWIVECRSCHKSLVFSDAKTDCFTCHTDIHQNTVGFNCERCHTPETWIVKDVKLVHQQGRFPLVGVHQSVDCTRCHSGYNNLNFQTLGASCYSCHSIDYKNTRNPNHVAAGFSTDCESCHSMISKFWSTQNFRHDFFPLTGGHKIDNCFTCHKQGTFSGLSNVCFSCHQSNYNSAPNHVAQSYPTTCEMCHNTTGWNQSTFNHQTTPFPLTGAHTTVLCGNCHQNRFAGIPTVCVSCHQANYNSTTNPNHINLQIATTCESCHSTNPGWQPASFPVHSNYFPLVGAHATSATCLSCHNGNYNNTPNQCSGCHLTSYNNSQNPKHQPAGISTLCQSCHNSTAWIPSTFSHTTTGFALTGVHLTIQCSSCHIATTSGLNALCVSCHLANYNSAPNHVAQSYPTTCEMCHNTTDWTQSTFNHQTTPFPLTGAHTTVLCGSCHQNGFAGTPTSCVSCHQDKYNATTNPNHISLQISTTCETCHSSNPGWQPASFPVHNNYYALAGAHISLTCTQCHNGNYLPTSVPTDCYSCHTTNYNNTTNPNHQLAQFPHDCQTCHTQSVWSPSTFNHDAQYFPIYSGSHNNRWTLCSQCHQSPTNFASFTCMSSGCHPQASTNSNHNGVSGYVYVASACYNCHPRGNGGGKTIIHQRNISK
jgi:hypothetical protein